MGSRKVLLDKRLPSYSWLELSQPLSSMQELADARSEEVEANAPLLSCNAKSLVILALQLLRLLQTHRLSLCELVRKGGDLCQYSDAYWVLSQRPLCYPKIKTVGFKKRAVSHYCTGSSQVADKYGVIPLATRVFIIQSFCGMNFCSVRLKTDTDLLRNESANLYENYSSKCSLNDLSCRLNKFRATPWKHE